MQGAGLEYCGAVTDAAFRKHAYKLRDAFNYLDAQKNKLNGHKRHLENLIRDVVVTLKAQTDRPDSGITRLLQQLQIAHHCGA